jgi:DNA-binding XRE family transcriptional regulator
MVIRVPKTINGNTFSTFNDLWDDPNYLTPEEKAEIDFKVEVKGAIIKKRESMGFTQTQLANFAHMTQPEIARIENELNNPKINTLIKVLTPLGYRLTVVATNDPN